MEHERKQQLKITAAVLEAQEKERTYLGQELHDNVNQMIVAAKLMLEQVKNNANSHDVMITKCLDSLERVIQETGNLPMNW